MTAATFVVVETITSLVDSTGRDRVLPKVDVAVYGPFTGPDAEQDANAHRVDLSTRDENRLSEPRRSFTVREVQAPTPRPAQAPPDVIDVAGVPTPITIHDAAGRRVSMDEWNLSHSTNGITLRAACEGEGLPVSGTNEARAKRLVEAGLTRDQVEAKYGWRARQTAPER